jgi:outer membrane protein OmpA-like peptidoglycan-associated protein
MRITRVSKRITVVGYGKQYPVAVTPAAATPAA